MKLERVRPDGPAPVQQQALLDRLLGRGDVPIPDLYGTLREPRGDETVQYQQRWLGPYIHSLNKNLAERGLRVEPGALKNTYRLVVLT